MSDSRVLVIGASNLDIKGQTDSYHIAKTSNPGSVQSTAGGVARNIAENLARLGLSTTLLSVVGDDIHSRHVLDVTAAAGVDLQHVAMTPEASTGMFLALLNQYGDLESAVADMSILSRLTPEYLASHQDLFKSASFVVVDADIPEPSLIFCIEECEKNRIPLCVEPISVARSHQILPYLDRMTMVTPNREEAEVLAGFPLRSAEDVRRAGARLVERGVRWAIITLGPEGVLAATSERVEFLPSISTVVTDTVGAGDALTAGTVCGLVEGLDFVPAVRQGIACATLTLTTRLAVHPDLNKQRVLAHQKRGETEHCPTR
jgi:pseudouridine kinase